MVKGTFRTALLLVFAGVVSAGMEYTVDGADSLDDYQKLINIEAKLFPYVLINPESKIRVNRISRAGEKDSELPKLSFYVSSDRIDEDEGGSSSSAAPPQSMDECDGKPGIGLTSARKSSLDQPSLSSNQKIYKTFCFTRMIIDVMDDPVLKPFMKLTMQFENDKKKESIKVKMSLFKPPTNKIDKKHADKNQVPRIQSPIPLSYFAFGSPHTKLIEENGVQYFINDISWMKEVLKRARFQRDADGNVIRRSIQGTTEKYLAGPVIIDEEPYNYILRL